jgi:glutathione S-transferase
MELYYTSGACSLAVHIVARELELPITLNKVDLATHKTEDGREFWSINPKGYVPALKLKSGEVLTEVAALLQYLAEQAPQTGLAPAHGTFERYRFNEWLTFISSEIHKGFGPLWSPVTPEAMRQATIKKLGQRFTYVDHLLADQPYLMGESFTAADAYLFTVVNWATYHNVELTPYPSLQAFLGRVYARSAVQQALRAEGLLKEAA